MTRYCVKSMDQIKFFVYDKEYKQDILAAKSWEDAARQAAQLNESIYQIERGIKYGKHYKRQQIKAA